jgi:phosphatidylglycerophosphate synthase
MSAAEGSATRPRHAWVLLPASAGEAQAASDDVRVWSLSSQERLRRALDRAGLEFVELVFEDGSLPEPPPGACAVFRSDYFYDERLIAGLLDCEDEVVLVGASPDEPIAARVGPDQATRVARILLGMEGLPDPDAAPDAEPLRRVEALDIAPAYNPSLRKFDPPFVYRSAAADARDVENRIFASSYKGITDLVTKWVFPLPARAVVRQLARAGVRPNTVTAVSYVLTALAAWLFYEGWFATGLVCAWAMTFLDTVDGKLARVTLTSSPIGNVLDHGLDLVHPPIWWAAWAFGLAPGAAGYELAMWVVVGGYVTGRLLEGVFLLAFGMEIFTWRPFDAFFRTIIARRNPNLLMLTAGVIAGKPGVGFLAVAVWTVACHVVPVVRISQAFTRRRRGVEILPWHEEQAQAAARKTAAASTVLLALLALAAPGLAVEPPPLLDPSARLPDGDSASEYWDLTARFDSGDRLFARFMITNVGPGSGTAIAVGHVVRPDGSVHAFRNGRRSNRWKLSDDRLQLDVGSCELDLRGPSYHLDVHKDTLGIDLRFEPRGAAQPASLPAGYAVQLLDSAAPARGSLRLPGMTAPLEVAGRVGLVHTWMSRPEAELAERRIEFFSLHKDGLYVLEVTPPTGPVSRFATVTGPSKWGFYPSISHASRLQGAPDDYRTPGVLELSGAALKGSIRLDRKILSHDFLSEIPQPFRFFVAMQMQPWRVWAEATFEGTLRANSELPPSQLDGSGITVVTFSAPTDKP